MKSLKKEICLDCEQEFAHHCKVSFNNMKTNELDMIEDFIDRLNADNSYWNIPKDSLIRILKVVLAFKDRQHREDKRRLIEGIPEVYTVDLRRKNFLELEINPVLNEDIQKYKQDHLNKLKD